MESQHNKHSVHPPPFLRGWEVEPPTKFSKRGLDKTSTFRGGLLGERGWHFSGGGAGVGGGGAAWEILPKNLVTFKKQDGIKNEKLWFGKVWLLGGSSRKTNIEGGGGGLDSLPIWGRGGTWQERGDGVFEGGWYPNAHYNKGITTQ